MNPPPQPVEGIDWASMLSTMMCIYVYAGIIVGLVVVTLSRSVCFFLVCMRCSQSLHDSMFANLVAATMRFFHTNPSGKTGRRVTKQFIFTETLKAFRHSC